LTETDYWTENNLEIQKMTQKEILSSKVNMMVILMMKLKMMPMKILMATDY
jgi:hypothetical protein